MMLPFLREAVALIAIVEHSIGFHQIEEVIRPVELLMLPPETGQNRAPDIRAQTVWEFGCGSVVATADESTAGFFGLPKKGSRLNRWAAI